MAPCSAAMCRGYVAELSGPDDRLCPAECYSECSELCGVQRGAQCDAVASKWDEDRHLLGRMFETQSGGAAYQGPVAAAAHAARRPVSHKLGVAAGLAAGAPAYAAPRTPVSCFVFLFVVPDWKCSAMREA